MPEIEITDAMVEAGVKVLGASGKGFTPYDPVFTVREIFSAMMAARDEGKPENPGPRSFWVRLDNERIRVKAHFWEVVGHELRLYARGQIPVGVAVDPGKTIMLPPRCIAAFNTWDSVSDEPL